MEVAHAGIVTDRVLWDAVVLEHRVGVPRLDRHGDLEVALEQSPGRQDTGLCARVDGRSRIFS